MNKKYNLALLPENHSNQVISLARNFENIHDQYILGDTSFPHVTLYQFYFDENDIQSIIQKVKEKWKRQTLILNFKKIQYDSFDKKTYWISLIPNENQILQKYHKDIAELLNLPIKKSYDPHMTLLNTKFNNYASKVESFQSQLQPIKDIFKLSLGESDEIGQFKKIITKFQ